MTAPTVTLRRDLPPLPARMAQLPLDGRGYPVPWFVAWIGGVPDFRVIGTDKVATAHNRKLCWLCGQRLGTYLAFVIGPMCAVNRVSSEPPSHRECAEFAAVACPFLARPKAKRRKGGLPDDARDAAGVGVARNPGAMLVWVTKGYTVQRVPPNAPGASPGVLFKVGHPLETLWYANGRRATRAEVMESIESGLPLLAEPAMQEGPAAVAKLHELVTLALTLVPAA